jgi:hypothetical protein
MAGINAIPGRDAVNVLVQALGHVHALQERFVKVGPS